MPRSEDRGDPNKQQPKNIPEKREPEKKPGTSA